MHRPLICTTLAALSSALLVMAACSRNDSSSEPHIEAPPDAGSESAAGAGPSQDPDDWAIPIGGAAGNTSGGQSGTGGTAPIVEVDWMHDPALWTPLPYPEGFDGELCPLFGTLPDKAPIPGFQWVSTAEGREEASVDWLEQPLALIRLGTTKLVQGDEVTTLGVVTSNKNISASKLSTEVYYRWIDGASGKPLAIMKRNNLDLDMCVAIVPGREGVWTRLSVIGIRTLYFSYDRKNGGGFQMTAHHDKSMGMSPGDVSYWDEGQVALHQGGSAKIIRYLFDKKTIDTLDMPAAILHGETQTGLSFWTAPNINGLLAWANDEKGARILVQDLPHRPRYALLSDTLMVSILTDHNGDDDKMIWYAARTAIPGNEHAKARIVPSLHGWNISNARTWGDFVAISALHGSPGEPLINYEWKLVIVQLSTGKVWSVPNPKGECFPELTVDSTHVYVTQANWPKDGVSTARKVLRYELAKIDAWGTLTEVAQVVPIPSP